MVACYHPVYIFNRVSVCNHSCTKTNGFNQIPCIPLRKYNRNREWHCWLRELPIRQTDGSIQHNSIAHIPTDTTFFQTMHIRQIAGVSPSQACREYTHPAFINENLARLLNIDVSHIGHKLNEFDGFSDSLSIIARISHLTPWKKKSVVNKYLLEQNRI